MIRPLLRIIPFVAVAGLAGFVNCATAKAKQENPMVANVPKPPDLLEIQVSPLMPSKVKGVSIKGVIEASEVASAKFTAKMLLTVPEHSHACLGYVAFETVRVADYGPRGSDTINPPVCIDVGAKVVTADISLRRTDLPFFDYDSRKAIPGGEDIKEGYIIMTLVIDGDVSVYRLDSFYFKKNAFVIKSK